MSRRSQIATLVAGTALVLAAPAAIAESQRAVAPDHTEPPVSGTAPPAAAPAAAIASNPATPPTRELPPQAGARATPELPPQAGAGATPELPPQAGAGGQPEPTPEPGPDNTPEPAPETGAGAPSERPQDDPATTPPEPTVQPPAPAQTPGNGPGSCFITSAGLICPGTLNCIITSAGVNCAPGCTITSAGFSCPTGGEVLPGRPVSGGPKPNRGQPPPVKGELERKPKDEGNVSPTTVARVGQTGGQTLPFTGAAVLAWLVLGCALWTGGLLLRRRTSTARVVAELSADAEPLAVGRGPAPREGGLPFPWVLVLASLALLARGILLGRGTRR